MQRGRQHARNGRTVDQATDAGDDATCSRLGTGESLDEQDEAKQRQTTWGVSLWRPYTMKT
eukprot:15478763-Alexandrium_andersonii.AAC.1